jgi:hypothetical protein
MKVLRNISSVFRIALFLILLPLMLQMAFAADQEVMWQYTVRPGDNLITLGRLHLINPDDWKQVQKLNHVKDPYRMPIGLVLKVPVVLVKQGPATAQVLSVSGNAVLETADGEVALAAGQILGSGARLVTKDNSKVVIKFADETLVSMTSNSKLVLDALSLYSGGAMVDTKLRLQRGQVETHANPKQMPGNSLHIITPSAIAAVRGTEFRVAADDQSIKQETLKGRVALIAAGQEVAVDKGYGSYAELGKPPSPPVELLAAIDTSKLANYYDRLPIAFDLPLQRDAVSFEGRVFTDVSLKNIVAEAVTNQQQLVFKDLPNGDYFLSLRAKDKNGLAGYDSLHAFSVNARPFAPKLISPIQNTKFKNITPILRWGEVDDAKRYIVEIAVDAEFKQPLKSILADEAMIQIDDKLTPRAYFWRVASVAQTAEGIEDKGLYSKVGQFEVSALPPKPDISKMEVKVAVNRIYIKIPPPLEGLNYQFVLDNPINDQKNVWEAQGENGQYTVLLKEYGKQLLSVSYVDDDGDSGPTAFYEFDAYPQ